MQHAVGSTKYQQCQPASAAHQTIAVLKNLTNIFVLAGDFYFYGRTYNQAAWACVGLMLLSAVAGGATDLSFNPAGYFWQIVNCGFTASYSLYLRGAMDRVAEFTLDNKKLGEFSMVRWAAPPLVRVALPC